MNTRDNIKSFLFDSQITDFNSIKFSKKSIDRNSFNINFSYDNNKFE